MRPSSIAFLRPLVLASTLLLGARILQAGGPTNYVQQPTNLAKTPPALAPGLTLYAASAYSDLDYPVGAQAQGVGRLHKLDSATGRSLGSISLWCATAVYGNNHGLARHPGTGQIYGVFSLDGANDVNKRYLCTLNIVTGEITKVGGPTNGEDVASIAFDAGGSLFGSTGSSSSYEFGEFDLSNGAFVRLFELDHTNSGSALAFQPADEHFMFMSSSSFSRFTNGNNQEEIRLGGNEDNAYAVVALSPDWYLANRGGRFFEAVRRDGLAIRLGNAPEYFKGFVIAPDQAFSPPSPSPTRTPLALSGQALYSSDNGSSVINKRSAQTGAFISSVTLNHDTQSVSSGFTNFAKHPSTGVIYGALAGGNACGYCLATVDPRTGKVDPIGLPGNGVRLHSLAFTADGRLWATTGQSSALQRQLLRVNPATGAADPLFNLNTLDPNGSSLGATLAPDLSGTQLIAAIESNAETAYYRVNPDTQTATKINMTGYAYYDQMHSFFPAMGNIYFLLSRQGGVYHVDLAQNKISVPIFKLDGETALVLANDVTQASPTITNTPAAANTNTNTFTATRTTTPTKTGTHTHTATNTETPTSTGSITDTNTPSPTRTQTPTVTYTPTSSYTPHPAFSQVVYGLADNGNTIRQFDLTTFTELSGADLAVTLPFGDGLKGLAKHPTSGAYYTLIVLGSGGPRTLATISLTTGQVTAIGSTGQAVNSLAFTPDGTLWGMNGGNGGYANYLVTIDIATGRCTPKADYSGYVSSSRAIAYNQDLNRLMLINNYSPARLDSIEPGSFELNNITEVDINDTPSSVLYLGYGLVLVGDRSNYMTELSVGGANLRTASLGGSYISGLALGPQLTFVPTATETNTFTETETPGVGTATVTPTITPTDTQTPSGVLFANDGDSASLILMDSQSMAQLDNVNLRMAKGSNISIDKMTGLAKGPDGTVYGLVVVNGNNSNRRLVTVDLVTGVCTQLAKLPNYFSGLVVDGYGQIYAVTSDNASDPRNTLFRFNEASGVMEPIKPLPGVESGSGGYDGIALAYNPDDNFIYFLAGEQNNNVTVFGRYDAATLNYEPLIIDGNNGSEVKSLTYEGQGRFFVSFKSGDFGSLTTAGHLVLDRSYSGGLKGMIYRPAVAMASPTDTPAPTAFATPSLMLYSGDNGGSVHQYNANTGVDEGSVQLRAGSYGVNDIIGFARNPVSGIYYAVVNFNSNDERILGIADPITGDFKVIGRTGQHVNAIAFGADGTLYAAVGHGDNPQSSIYKVNPSTAKLSFQTRLPRIEAGYKYSQLALGFNPDDGRLYFAGKESEFEYRMVFGSYDVSTWGFIERPLSEELSEEPRGLAYAGNGVFYMTTNSSYDLYMIHTSGEVLGVAATTSDRFFGAEFDVARNYTVTATDTPTAYPTPAGVLISANEGQTYDQLDPNSGSSTGSSFNFNDPLRPYMTRFFGMAKHPYGQIYAVVGNNNNSHDRRLYKLNLGTGEGTLQGATSGNVNGIAFGADGTLYGTTGNAVGTAAPHALVSINPNTGACTVLANLPHDGSEGGAALSFNADDGKLYFLGKEDYGAVFGRFTLPAATFERIALNVNLPERPRAMLYYGYNTFYLSLKNGDMYLLRTNGNVDGISSPGTKSGMVLVPAQTFGTATETFTVSPTPSATETAIGTFTITETPSISPSASETPSASSTPTITVTITVTMTPTYTKTVNLSDTVTRTSTITKTATLTRTASVTRTFQPTRTATPTYTVTPGAAANTPASFVDGSSVLGTNLGVSLGVAKKGQDLCMAFASQPQETGIELYNLNGEKVTTATLSGPRQCVRTNKIAPGVYFMKMNIKLNNGKTQERWQKIAIFP